MVFSGKHALIKPGALPGFGPAIKLAQLYREKTAASFAAMTGVL